MNVPIFIPTCPRQPLPDSMLIQDCNINWANIVRVVFRDLNGVVPFGGIDSATQITSLETQADWVSAIAATDPDSIVLTPKITNAVLTAGDAQTEELEDSSISWSGDFGFSQLELTFRGLSSENEAKLNELQGTGLGVMFILKDGTTLCYDLTDSDGTKDMFFAPELVTFGGRNHATGSTPDSNMMTITFQKEALMGWAYYDTASFGLIL